MITHLFIFDLRYPANLSKLIAIVFPILHFDVIPAEKVFAYIFDFDKH